MTFTLVENVATGERSSGVSVSVYNPDNRTIAQTVVTGADGVASFDSLPAPASPGGGYTVTLINELADRLEIDTIHAVPAGDHAILFGDEVDEPCERVGSLQAKLGGLTSGERAGLVLHSDSHIGFVNASGELGLDNVPVCQSDVQTDNRVSGLVYSLGSQGQNTFDTYGVFLDLPIGENIDLAGTADRPLEWVDWSAASRRDVFSFRLGATRKGVVHSFVTVQTGGEKSGKARQPIGFPADHFLVSAVSYYDKAQSLCFAYHAVPDPRAIAIAFAEYGATTLSIDTNERSMAVSIATPAVADYVIVVLESGVGPSNSWSFALPPAPSGTFPIPDLPPTYADRVKIDRATLTIPQATVVSYANFEGFAAVLNSLLSSGKPGFDTGAFSNQAVSYCEYRGTISP